MGVRARDAIIVLGCAAGAAGLVFCNVYDSSLLVPGPSSGTSLPPIYLAIRSLWNGSLDPQNKPSQTAWQDIGFDLDGVCTSSPTCPTDTPIVSCKPTGLAVPVDGNYCRDNTFGRLEVQAANIKEVGGKYGLNDDAFDCALCVGDYNFVLKVSDYNGTGDDDHVRLDIYPSPGVASPLPWDCSQPDWRNHPCLTPDTPFTIRDTAVTAPQGGPSLADAVINDPNAFVKSGYVIATLPPNTLFWFPGKNALAKAFPLTFTSAIVAAHIVKAQDGTWSIDDGTIGGRSTEKEVIHGFRLIGFCESDPNFMLMTNFLHASLDILASGANDPATTCDSISVGLRFTATQAVAGPLVHVDDLVECGGADGGVDGGSDAIADATGQ
jgi:hypothetical protein